MHEFNETYGEIAAVYLEKNKDELILIDGFTFYDGDDSVFCLHQAPEYRLPTDIQEFISQNFQKIMKLHGYDITVSLKLAPEWHDMRINNIGGNDMMEFYDGDIIPCSHCRTNVNEHSYWFNRGHVLCIDCYDNKLKVSRLPKKGWMRIHDPDMNFLDYVEFMREPKENPICSGSVFFTNCNPASKNYGKIMVTTSDSHGRQRFDILYDNVEHLFRDILNWFTTVPSAFTSDELTEQYDYAMYFEMNPEDIPVDQELELPGSDWKHMEEVLNSPCTSWQTSRAVEYGIIGEGEILTNRMVLENAYELPNIKDPNAVLQKIINRYTEDRDNANGFRARKVGPSGRSKSIADLTDEEIVEKSQKDLQKLLNTPVFDVYSVEKIYDLLKESIIYKNPCYAAFTVWYRVQYDLGFNWG